MPKILLIDDHSMILKGLSAFFLSTSIEIAGTFNNLTEVAEYCSKFDQSKLNDDKYIAILDIDLGEESGFDAIHSLKVVGIDVIIFSMFSSSSYVVKAMELGAKGYVSKSADDEELILAINAVNNGDIYIQKNLIPSFMFSASIFSGLTSREKNIIECIINHMDNYQIAQKLGIAKRTVENHLSRIYDKFGVQNKHQLEEKLK